MFPSLVPIGKMSGWKQKETVFLGFFLNTKGLVVSQVNIGELELIERQGKVMGGRVTLLCLNKKDL